MHIAYSLDTLCTYAFSEEKRRLAWWWDELWMIKIILTLIKIRTSLERNLGIHQFNFPSPPTFLSAHGRVMIIKPGVMMVMVMVIALVMVMVMVMVIVK